MPIAGVEGEELAVQEDRIELKREAVDASGQAGAQEAWGWIIVSPERRVNKLERRSMGMTWESRTKVGACTRPVVRRPISIRQQRGGGTAGCTEAGVCVRAVVQRMEDARERFCACRGRVVSGVGRVGAVVRRTDSERE